MGVIGALNLSRKLRAARYPNQRTWPVMLPRRRSPIDRGPLLYAIPDRPASSLDHRRMSASVNVFEHRPVVYAERFGMGRHPKTFTLCRHPLTANGTVGRSLSCKMAAVGCNQCSACWESEPCSPPQDITKAMFRASFGFRSSGRCKPPVGCFTRSFS